MADFRFPHPFENIGDAIKDAFDPGTPADGTLVTQLMNENNRAVEDRFAETGVVVFNGAPSGPHTNGTTVTFDVPAGTRLVTLRVAWDGETIGDGLTPQPLYATVVPDPGPFYDARSMFNLTGPGTLSGHRYTLAEVIPDGGSGGVQCTLHAPGATSLDAEFTLTLSGITA